MAPASSPDTEARAAAVFALLPFAALTFVLTVATVGKTTRLLVGLTYYLIPETDAERARARLARVQSQNASARRKEKRRKDGGLASLAKEDDEDSIAALKLTKANLVLKPFWSHFDHLVFFTVAVAANWAAAEGRAAWIHARIADGSIPESKPVVLENPLLALMCVVGAGSASRALVLMELDRGTPGLEKAVAGAVAVAGFVASSLLLMLVPDTVLDFEIDRTSVEFAPAVVRAIRRKAGRALGGALEVGGSGSLVVSRAQIAIGLSVFAGLLAGSLFPPAVRASRSYLMQTAPPAWSESITRADGTSRRVAHAAFAAPLVAAASFFSPLFADPLGLSAATVAIVRPASLLATALLMTLSVPFLVQGHLNGSLVTWYELKFGETARGDGGAIRAAARIKAEVTNHVAVKVAVQAAAPAALMACLACLLGAKRRLDPIEEESGSLTGVIPSVCWRTVAGFLGWWVAACWGSFTALGVALGRNGVAPFAP
jgi:hypothetical protein